MGVRQEEELISAIVPAYNAAATLGDTLQSALAQTHQNLEVLVVDDGSTDATAEIAATYAARNSRVRLLQQTNAGVAAARNLAIAHAGGVCIAPLDADDLWHPEKIEAQVAIIRQEGPRVGVVYCWWRRIDMGGSVCGEEWHPYPHQGNVYTALIMGNILGCASSPLILKSYLAEIGGYDTDARVQGCEDLMLYLRLAERCDFALVPRFLVGYRFTRGSVSSDARRMLLSQKLVLTEAQQRQPEVPASLFRLAEARCEYQRGKAFLRCGMWATGLTVLWCAVRRDPAGAMYRIAEPLHRLATHALVAAPRGDHRTSHNKTACAYELATPAGDLSTAAVLAAAD